MFDFEIIVIGNKRKKILTTEYLKDIDHTVFYSTDYDLPIGWKKTSRYTNGTEIGAYRCFKAHVDAINSSTCDNILIFEDDAVPNTSNWLDIATTSISLLDKYEIVSLHGRNIHINKFNTFKHNGISFIYPKTNPSRVLGSLSYFINRKTIHKLNSIVYDGTPMDILLSNYFSYCCIEKSPFNHDRSFGSLCDGNAKE